jgi:hypothetical protein
MFSTLSLFALGAQAQASVDPYYPCDTHHDNGCMQQYNNATAVCAAQVNNTSPMPAGDLHNFGSEMGQMVEIVNVGTHNQLPNTNKSMDYETWFTRKEENVEFTAKAIGDMDFDGHSDDEIKNMIIERVSAALGMQSEGKDCVINLGRTEVKQQDPSGTDTDGGFFRPCWNDFKIDNTDCHYVEDAQQVPWVGDHARSSFEMGTKNEFPFVGLGYTFDWMAWEHGGKNKNDSKGMNEFVLLGHRGTVVDWYKMCSPLAYFCEVVNCTNGNCGNFSEWATRNCDNDEYKCQTSDSDSTTSASPSLVLI